MTKNKTKQERLMETEESRLLRYSRQRKENERLAREARKREIRENRRSDRRLFFIIKTISSLRLTQKEIAARIGKTQQTLSWAFSVKDDCRLSLAQQIMNCMGYSLGVWIKRDAPKNSIKDRRSGCNKGTVFVIEGEIVEDYPFKRFPDYIRNCNPDRRLYFLAEYLMEIGDGTKEITRKTNLDLTSIRHMFMQDDVKISQIFNIARRTGGVIVWTINKL